MFVTIRFAIFHGIANEIVTVPYVQCSVCASVVLYLCGDASQYFLHHMCVSNTALVLWFFFVVHISRWKLKPPSKTPLNENHNCRHWHTINVHIVLIGILILRTLFYCLLFSSFVFDISYTQMKYTHFYSLISQQQYRTQFHSIHNRWIAVMTNRKHKNMCEITYNFYEQPFKIELNCWNYTKSKCIYFCCCCLIDYTVKLSKKHTHKREREREQ